MSLLMHEATDRARPRVQRACHRGGTCSELRLCSSLSSSSICSTRSGSPCAPRLRPTQRRCDRFWRPSRTGSARQTSSVLPLHAFAGFTGLGGRVKRIPASERGQHGLLRDAAHAQRARQPRRQGQTLQGRGSQDQTTTCRHHQPRRPGREHQIRAGRLRGRRESKAPGGIFRDTQGRRYLLRALSDDGDIIAPDQETDQIAGLVLPSRTRALLRRRRVTEAELVAVSRIPEVGQKESPLPITLAPRKSSRTPQARVFG